MTWNEIQRKAIIVIIAVLICALVWEICEHYNNEIQMKKQPDKYSRCLVDGYAYPHKKMYALGDDIWVSHGCMGRFPWKFIEYLRDRERENLDKNPNN